MNQRMIYIQRRKTADNIYKEGLSERADDIYKEGICGYMNNF